MPLGLTHTFVFPFESLHILSFSDALKLLNSMSIKLKPILSSSHFSQWCSLCVQSSQLEHSCNPCFFLFPQLPLCPLLGRSILFSLPCLVFLHGNLPGFCVFFHSTQKCLPKGLRASHLDFIMQTLSHVVLLFTLFAGYTFSFLYLRVPPTCMLCDALHSLAL